ncbi:hypothetical protein [Brevibacillus massiliensis]|jgi:hypothetical protein|uniref:hypothetical protein n=1 Tax=Brevibacillus massiliensis TaxID=1118054 RepID=UPI0002FA6C26|nr:hypothetical protein [Brevibacillus massiliensis]
MLTIFIEYKIVDGKREEAIGGIAELERQTQSRGGMNYRCFEGFDQPGLFVEMFEVADESVYYDIKRWRTEGGPLDHCIAGGSAKIHVWAFQPAAAKQQEEKRRGDG